MSLSHFSLLIVKYHSLLCLQCMLYFVQQSEIIKHHGDRFVSDYTEYVTVAVLALIVRKISCVTRVQTFCGFWHIKTCRKTVVKTTVVTQIG